MDDFIYKLSYGVSSQEKILIHSSFSVWQRFLGRSRWQWPAAIEFFLVDWHIGNWIQP